jgi:BirA family transcriptional regulator, biotin operon repressor / biotin---[acetyl-CoA-carboxylase] ligase
VTGIAGWPDAIGLRIFESLDSTNEEARRLAKGGERGPLWIMAHEQTAGRGRRGRAWVSQRGNLFATLLIPAEAPLAAQLAFAAALAVGETVSAYAPSSSVALKWPNDVLLEGGKVAGILLEAVGQDMLAIGIGINLAHHPEETEFPATSIASPGRPAPVPGDALLRLAGRMAAWYEIWRQQGFAPLRTTWLSRAAGLGQAVRVRREQNELHGMLESLDSDGALLLRQASGGIARITAGDVFFRP